MEGTPKAIEMKGIVRNATKIGVRDGQAEDLINLRFMDGSWRASGDGRLIQFTMGRTYSQLYVHTNIYHHLLGVYEGTLYWFAEIGTDGTSFYPLDNTTSRTQWPEDMQDLPTEPKRLTDVVGNIWITQTGHLLTVIDENDDFEHFVFKTGENEYIDIEVDANGSASNRTIYPFGEIHFNCYCPGDSSHKINPNIEGTVEVQYQRTQTLVNKTQEKNRFSQHFLAIAAFKLYDGSYAYACNPVHLSPREKLNKPDTNKWFRIGDYTLILDTTKAIVGLPTGHSTDGDPNSYRHMEITMEQSGGRYTRVTSGNAVLVDNSIVPWIYTHRSAYNGHEIDEFSLFGSDLVISLDKNIIDRFDENVIKSLCIFVTKESNIYPTVSSRQDLRNRLSEFEYDSNWKTTEVQMSNFSSIYDYVDDSPFSNGSTAVYRKDEDIINDLLHSPFYLIKEYKKEEMYELLENPIVDLQDAAHKEILKTDKLVQQTTLPIEATSRTTYLPKVTYQYNGRLHIANYKSYPFFGYPIDMFHLHNHSVKVQEGSWFKGVLPDLAANNDEYLQYSKKDMEFIAPREGQRYFAYVKVDIDGSNGEQTVVRYIQPYDHSVAEDGRADFIESLNPLLTYPDARAKHLEIIIIDAYDENNVNPMTGDVYPVGFNLLSVDLKPHPYLNIAYHIDPELKPILKDSWRYWARTFPELPKMKNAEEYFPNGMKVSKPDDPMFFPVEKTYQVGSSEILALMSSTIPLGTGQTGAAPLVVFCKDGVYALLMGNIVPDTEKVTDNILYASAVPVSRDVCNNPRSVTPVDGGIVFSTDRGLMMATYDGQNFKIEEIGQPAEGDVVQFWNAGSVDYSKIATASMQQIAGLPSELCSTTDLLTYLQDKGTLGKAAIINYNHNMRELMVSNPNYPYSYVLDREGNWSRRDYTAAQYVNNYPTSYRVDADGHFYKVDDEGDANTTLEHRKEANNKIFYLSNVIKLDSIGFKQAYRFVVRGYFETIEGANIACVVEGSYDGRKFKPLGYNRKSGKFRDIGCIVERTDVRFFRICLSGQVTGKTRIDYMEMSAGASMLNTKIR